MAGKTAGHPLTGPGWAACAPSTRRCWERSSHQRLDLPGFLLSRGQQFDGLKQEERQPRLKYAEEFHHFFLIQTGRGVGSRRGLSALRLRATRSDVIYVTRELQITLKRRGRVSFTQEASNQDGSRQTRDHVLHGPAPSAGVVAVTRLPLPPPSSPDTI